MSIVVALSAGGLVVAGGAVVVLSLDVAGAVAAVVPAGADVVGAEDAWGFLPLLHADASATRATAAIVVRMCRVIVGSFARWSGRPRRLCFASGGVEVGIATP
jgi:hypothetical protein